MSYDVTSKKYPIAADVDAVATFLAQRQSDSGVTNGGIVASGGSPTVPDLTGNNASLAYLKAIVDALMCSTGYQAQSSSNALGAASTNSTTFADVGNGSSTGFAPFVWTPPVTKTYLVEVDFVAFCSAIAGGADDVFFQLLIGGVAFWPNDGRQAVYAVNQRNIRPHFTVPAAFTAGVATTIKLQAKVNTATTTVFNVDTACFRTITVRG